MYTQKIIINSTRDCCALIFLVSEIFLVEGEGHYMLIEYEYLIFHHNIDQMVVPTARNFLSLCFTVSSVVTGEL